MSTLYQSNDLLQFAEQLLLRAGTAPEAANITAKILLEGDLLGHTTHGLHLLAGYLNELDKGGMAKTGKPIVISDWPAAVCWDGLRLPGPYLVVQALDLALVRAKTQGTCTVAIRRSHHIACLAAYLSRATEHGMVAQIYSSDPEVASVAPHGGTRAVFTPNPMAIGIPTGVGAAPILIDVSTSVTTNGMSNRLAKSGQKFAHKWLLDSAGVPTDDPQVIAKGTGSIQLLGGVDVGHKGFGLSLMVEALTGGLAGHGRADPHEGWGATVFVQVINPAAFGGLPAFTRQVDWLVQACLDSPPRIPGEPVRLPGARGWALRANQLQSGVNLHPDILPALKPWADKYGITLPNTVV